VFDSRNAGKNDTATASFELDRRIAIQKIMPVLALATKVHSILKPESVIDLVDRAESHFREISEFQSTAVQSVQPRKLSPRGWFVPTASSLSLDAVLDDQQIKSLIAELMAGPLRQQISSHFHGAGLVVNLDQAWFRRQYVPADYPPLHSPHQWHQDGALNFDFQNFAGKDSGQGEVLQMLTCWIALNSCGKQAPGLELLIEPISRLLGPAELKPETVRSKYPPASYWRPQMVAGEAIIFPGDTLHRTYVTPSMNQVRTSLELRFFRAAAIPGRLSCDRYIKL